MQDLTGKSIGKYRIVEGLGQGGMATVYRAYDQQLERDVAIKLIRLEQFGPAVVEKMRLRFEREAKTLAKLTHPNIVNIIDYGEFEGIPYLVMPYLQGGTLKQYLGKPLSLEKAASLLTPIADALAYAHQKGIVHRDVKPANIMFTEGEQPMLTDFGIVRLLENEDGVTLTGTGMGIGTPEYMSPEQGLGHEVDGRTDIYSLGTVFYELITGQKPYTAITPMEIVLKQSTVPLKKPSLLVSNLGDRTDQILLKAMAREPAERYQTMKEFKDVLHRLSLESAISSPPPVVPIESPTISILPEENKQELATDYFATQVKPVAPTAKIEPVLKTEKQRRTPKEKTLTRSRSKKRLWIPVGILGVIAFAAGVSLLIPGNPLSELLGITIPVVGRQNAPSNATTAVPTRIAYITSTPTREPFSAPTETLRINISSVPDTLDPQKTEFMSEVTHLQLNYEGLTRLNNDLETIPGAAESWDYNADATEITFMIRENLRYSDDTILNAKRFEFALLRMLDPATQAGLSFFLDAISGAYAYRTADNTVQSSEQLATLRNAVAIHAFTKNGTLCSDYEQADCLVLKISMDQPSPQMHTILTMTMAFPAKEELIASGGEEWWKEAANQVGNGPYILRVLEFNSSAYFTPNPNYWGEFGKVNIEYHYMSQSEAAFDAYKNGDIDIVSLLANELAAARSDPEISSQVMVYPGSCTYALMIQQDRPPFNDVMVRQAFAYALDRERFVAEVLGGLGSPTLTWIPEGFPGYDAYENRWEFDPQKARQALLESSYQSASNLPSVTFAFTETTRNRQRAEWLVENYRENLGINIELSPMDAATYNQMIRDPETAPQLFLTGWCADYPDPSDWLSPYWRTGTYSDRIGYSDPEVDALLDGADSESDPNTRMQLYAEAQQKIIASVPAVFFYNNVNAYLVKPNVKNLEITPFDTYWPGIYELTRISIEP